MPNKRKTLAKRRKGKERAQRTRRTQMERAEPETLRRMQIDYMRRCLGGGQIQELIGKALVNLETERDSLFEEMKKMPSGEKRSQMMERLKQIGENAGNLRTFYGYTPFNERIGRRQENAYELLFRLYGTKWRDALEKPKQ